MMPCSHTVYEREYDGGGSLPDHVERALDKWRSDALEDLRRGRGHYGHARIPFADALVEPHEELAEIPASELQLLFMDALRALAEFDEGRVELTSSCYRALKCLRDIATPAFGRAIEAAEDAAIRKIMGENK